MLYIVVESELGSQATRAALYSPFGYPSLKVRFSYYIKNSAVKQSFLLSALYLSGTKATRANVNGSVATINYCLNPTNVGLPGSVGLAVRVRNVVSESNALAADTALSHFDTS